jgi:hypothetical protein
MSEQIKLNVIHRKDGLYDLFTYQPDSGWTDYCKAVRARNKELVNYIRGKYPRVLNEFRNMPFCFDKEGLPYRFLNAFAAYGLTKQQYLMIKLSLQYDENVYHNRTRSGKPVKWQTYHRGVNPTPKCVKRWEDPKYKPNPVK